MNKTFDNTNPYNSTLYNNTPLEIEYDKEWKRIENQLIQNKERPYNNLNPTGSFVSAFMNHDTKDTLYAKRLEDRSKRQNEKYSIDAAGTMDNSRFQNTKQYNENLAAFNRLKKLKIKNSSIPNDIIESDEKFDETKPINYYVKLEDELYERGFKGGKSRKSKKSKKSKKSRKTKKSRKSKK